MRVKIRIIFFLMTRKAKNNLVSRFGQQFYHQFVRLSKNELNKILPRVPDIGKSIFALNYLYGPCYIAWYKTLLTLGQERESAVEVIWQINESFVKSYPKPLLHFFAKNTYLGTFRKRAPQAERGGREGTLHPYDWRIEYRNIDKNTFGINIYECGMLKLAEKFDALDMFPGVCRMDYLFSHYFNNAFQRQGTLADGNQCCDCWYQFPGQCEWAPEKGFAYRK